MSDRLEPGDWGNAGIAQYMQEPEDPNLREALEAAAIGVPPPPAFRDQIEDQDPDDDEGYDRLLAQLDEED